MTRSACWTLTLAAIAASVPLSAASGDAADDSRSDATHGVLADAQPPAGAADLAQHDVIDQIRWLAGCWQRLSEDRVAEEQWMTPRGGLMLGMGRTVASDRVLEYEQTSIHTDGKRLVFTAKPSSQPLASFSSIEVGPSRVVFENLEHDFPQRVIYSITRSGQLAARIEGTQDGRLVSVEFPYDRVGCPGAGLR